ncbi:MAG: SDR family NAD(P)-dependent oxidoreductase [Actinomycetales bacterium]
MISVNQNRLLYMTHAALPPLLAAAHDGLREVADIVNISSIAGRQAWANFGVYNMTKFGMNGFHRGRAPGSHEETRPCRCARALCGRHRARLARQRSGPERARRLGCHPRATAARDIAERIAFMVTRQRRSSIAELWAVPTSQA